MRIASFNIHHGAPASGPVDLDATAAVIASLDADVVVVQEVDRRSRRTGRVDQADALSRATGLAVTFAPTIEGRWCSKRAYGMAVLSRVPLRDVEIVELPHGAGHERRVAIVATATDPASGAEVTVAGTHLQANAFDEALDQLAVVLDHLAARGGRRVVAGDLNLRPHHVEGPFAVAGFAPVATDLTFPSDSPTIRIDWIAVAGFGADEREATVGEVIDAQVSDHRPIVADLAMFTTN